MAKKIASYILALSLGLLMIAPPLDYSIPLMVNSFFWCYLVVVSGLLGTLLWFQKIHLSLKILSTYLFISCFFSQAPYLSFNAYLLVVATISMFIFFQNCDFEIIFNVIEAAFWFEAILAILQLMGRDKLLNFDRHDHVFLGTVMQYMRFSSLLAIMTPFLFFRRWWYVFPVFALCVASQSSSFALAVIFYWGVAFYLIGGRKGKIAAIFFSILLCGLYALYDLGSFRGAIIASNGGRIVSWIALLKTWVFDTAASAPANLSGPFNLKWFLVGHGMDTFLPLFPIYKHDPNPFPQAHNDWLQFLWETGLFGFGLITWYCSSLFKRLLKCEEPDLIAGLVCIGTNMFFAFPTRMTQTALLMVAYLALCEIVLKQSETNR